MDIKEILSKVDHTLLRPEKIYVMRALNTIQLQYAYLLAL